MNPAVEAPLPLIRFCRLPAEDPVHRRREGAEAAADGPGRGHEEQRLPLHRAVLRRSVPRGDVSARDFAATAAAAHSVDSHGSLLCVSGRLLDLYGTYGYLVRQILQVCILLVRLRDSGGDFRKDHVSGKCLRPSASKRRNSAAEIFFLFCRL